MQPENKILERVLSEFFLRSMKALVVTCAVIAPATAQSLPADSAAVLSAYQGNWNGNGEARPNLKSALTRITCRIATTFDPEEVSLLNKGKCGTTQGSRKLRGKLIAKADGLTGDFLGAAAAQGLLNQQLRIVDNMIVSEAEVEEAGKMVKVRTFLTPPKDDAFLVQSQFFDRAKNEWVVAGEIEFRRQ